MEANGTPFGPDNERREYRHTRRARATGFLIAGCGALFAVGFIGLLLALLLGSDLSYMRFWPWWFRVFFWITLASFPVGISALYTYIGLRQLALVRRHYEDVAIADHEGLTLLQGRVSVRFPW